MNYLLRFLVIALFIVLAVSLLGKLVPDGFIDGVDSSIVYFLSYLNYLQPLLHVDVLFACIKVFFNVVLGVATFYMGWALFNKVAG